MPECSRKLAWENRASPRTCAICGKGPCTGGAGGQPWEVGAATGGGSVYSSGAPWPTGGGASHPPVMVAVGPGGAGGAGSNGSVQQFIREALTLLRKARPLADMESVALFQSEHDAIGRLLAHALAADAARVQTLHITTETKAPPSEGAAHHLWTIVEDIDRVDDMAGAGLTADAAFRMMTRNLIEKRWDVAEIPENGDTVRWKEAPPEDEPKPS